MRFVLDCSMTMARLFQDEATERTDAVRDSLLTRVAVVPVLWSIEVANVLLVATRKGSIRVEDWLRIRADLAMLPIETDGKTAEYALTDALPLAQRYGLSAYDAVYLELALRLKAPLATLDRKLAAVCHEAGIDALTG
ncbi:MAG TPA: PIN domain-containing protein [Methylothermaceae bacterium]|nr:PIN domain-containing protein [Methylothermaceae bacterium]